MKNISEEKELKEKFGKLGLFLVEKANKNIKELKKQSLYQLAESKKKSFERKNEISSKIKNNLLNEYNRYLHDVLSSSILTIKQKILNLKNNLIENLKDGIIKKFAEKTRNNYSEYVKYLFKIIENNKNRFDPSLSLQIIVNASDYKYFKENIQEIQKNFENKINLKKSSENFSGGFKLINEKEGVISDYTLESLINQYMIFVEKEFNLVVKSYDIKIEEIENNIQTFIDQKGKDLQETLNLYERI